MNRLLINMWIVPNLSLEDIHTGILIAAIVVCLMIAILGYQFYKKGKWLEAKAAGENLYQKAEGSFRANISLYEKLSRWLKAIGAEYSMKSFGDPFQFVMINALIATGILTAVSIRSGFLNGLLTSVAVLGTELLLLMLIDQKHNSEMLDDVSFLYDATAIQLNSNIYIVQAIANSMVYVKSKRLKQALIELCSKLSLGGDVRNATRDFKEKFNNEYLDTFCNAVVQIAAESGEAGMLVEDMARQLSVLKEATFTQKKKATENRLQLCIIGMFLVFTLLIFYLCVASMTGSAGMLFVT